MNLTEVKGSLLQKFTYASTPDAQKSPANKTSQNTLNVGTFVGEQVGGILSGFSGEVSKTLENVGYGANSTLQQVGYGAGAGTNYALTGVASGVKTLIAEGVGSGVGEGLQNIGTGAGTALGNLGTGAGTGLKNLAISAIPAALIFGAIIIFLNVSKRV